MASPEKISINRSEQLKLIDSFRSYYSEQSGDSLEITSEMLVSHHDPTIRFTNSTTSVMKPYLLGLKELDRTLYLAQPAMGQQGLHYWQRDGVFGPYASYFASLGSLYPVESEGRRAGLDMQALAERWGLPISELTFAVHETDQDIVPILEETNISVDVKSVNVGDFRHTYGLENVGGRNANLLARNCDETLRTLGNLTLISSGNDVLGYEVSFDSTTATSLAKNLPHPVQAHNSRRSQSSDIEIAAIDTLTVSAALLTEGMVPVSKGRAGVLRKFMREYVRLSRDELGFSVQDTQAILNDAIHEELVLRTTVSPSTGGSRPQPAAADAMDKWVRSTYEQS